MHIKYQPKNWHRVTYAKIIPNPDILGYWENSLPLENVVNKSKLYYAPMVQANWQPKSSSYQELKNSTIKNSRNILG